MCRRERDIESESLARPQFVNELAATAAPQAGEVSLSLQPRHGPVEKAISVTTTLPFDATVATPT